MGGNYAKYTDQSIANDGHNIDQSLCNGFDSIGDERGQPGVMVENLDYGEFHVKNKSYAICRLCIVRPLTYTFPPVSLFQDNNFVGHYGAGDIQHNGHHSYNNLNLIYWKETKNFGNGCSSHLVGGSYANGNMALPDQSTFIIEDTTFGNDVQLEANHHCNVGVTGVLCFPQYVLVSVGCLVIIHSMYEPPLIQPFVFHLSFLSTMCTGRTLYRRDGFGSKMVIPKVTILIRITVGYLHCHHPMLKLLWMVG